MNGNLKILYYVLNGGMFTMNKLKRWLLRQLGIIHKVDLAEQEILDNISKLGIDQCWDDEITAIVMSALSKLRYN